MPTKWECKVCDKQFDRKANYDRHCKTKYHNSRVERNKPVQAQSPPPQPDQTNAALLELVKQLQNEISELKNKPVSPTQHSPFRLAPVPGKKYTINQILSRKDTDIPVPDEKWKTYLNTAYYCKHEATHISSYCKHLEKAANLLLGKIENTAPEKLPMLVVNKKAGVEKKLAYYEGDPSFILRSGVTKKQSVQLYNCLDIYLSRSVGQLWFEPYLKEIYRTLPIEIRNKVHYRGDDNRIGFLDFMCIDYPLHKRAKTDTQDKKCKHYGCWNAKLFDSFDAPKDTIYWKWRNRDLINVDDNKFRFNDEEFNKFRSKFADHVLNHEHYEYYVTYRQNQFNCYFSTETCEEQERVLEELYIQVCRLCNVNEILKLN